MSQPPTTHYGRPFQLGLFKTGLSTLDTYCVSGRSNFQVNIDYASDFMHTYKDSGFFGLTFLNQYSHDSNENLNWIDDHLLHFLENFKRNKALSSSTILILFSDHGARYGSIRKSVKGLLHERNPFFSIYLPGLFEERYPDQARSLRENSNKISTPMDVHETLKNLLDLEQTNAATTAKQTKFSGGRSTSLFRPIPATRNCNQAGVEPHWCSCLKRTQLAVDDGLVEMAHVFIEYLNKKILDGHSEECEPLELDNVNKVFLLDSFVNSYVADNGKEAQARRSVWEWLNSWRFLQEMPVEVEFRKFQFQVRTRPNGGLYEFTLTSEPAEAGAPGDRGVRVEASTISRINSYGSSARCIADNYPDLRKFCFCKNL